MCSSGWWIPTTSNSLSLILIALIQVLLLILKIIQICREISVRNFHNVRVCF